MKPWWKKRLEHYLDMKDNCLQKKLYKTINNSLKMCIDNNNNNNDIVEHGFVFR